MANFWSRDIKVLYKLSIPDMEKSFLKRLSFDAHILFSLSVCMCVLPEYMHVRHMYASAHEGGTSEIPVT